MAELKGSISDLGGVLGSTKQEGNRVYMYVYTADDVAQGEVGVISYDGDEEYNPTFGTPATETSKQIIAVAPKVVDVSEDGYYFWAQIKGDCEALVEGTTDVAKDNFLEVLNGTSYFVQDATSRSDNSAAIAQEAQATNSSVLTNVYLFGDEGVVVAAS
jgi:hypothetical protein